MDLKTIYKSTDIDENFLQHDGKFSYPKKHDLLFIPIHNTQQAGHTLYQQNKVYVILI